MPKSDIIWRIIFVTLMLSATLALILAISPGPQAQWQEIKNSTVQAKAAILQIAQSSTLQTNPAQESQGPRSDDAVTFLILGEAGQGYDAPDLTDTILLARFTPAEKKVNLFSLPRDLLVKVPGQETWTKLNALYAMNKKDSGHEFDLIKQKAQEITGLTIDHYILVDLATVKDLVDTLGGVNVMVEKDIVDNAFPGPNHSFQTFEIKAGWRFLDGDTALKYIRSRHSEGGDFDRINRQQEVLQAIKQKILSLNFWDVPTFIKIFNTLASRIKTDLNLWQMNDFWDKIKNVPGQNVIKTEINTADLVTTGQADLGGVAASIVQPIAGPENYEAIKNYIAQTLNQ